METIKTENVTNKRGFISFPKGINRQINTDGNPSGIPSLEDITGDNTFASDTPPAVTLTPEQTALLNEHKGVSFDTEGNILNAEGTIIKTKADLQDTAGQQNSNNNQNNSANNQNSADKGANSGDTPPDDNEVTFDTYLDKDGNLRDSQGIIYTKEEVESKKLINDKGDLVDLETGEVLVTAAKLAENAANYIPNPLILDLQATYGYEFKDEAGKPKAYSDDLDGLKAYVNDVVETRVKESQQSFLEHNSDIKEFALHILAGGTKDSFYNRLQTDFRNLDISKMDDSQKVEAAYVYYGKKGINKEHAQMMVKAMKDSDTFDKFAVDMVTELSQISEKEYEADLAAIQENEATRQTEIKEYWESVDNTIKEGKLATIGIPEVDKKAFWDYLTTPVDKEGNTQELLDRQKEDIKYDLQTAYLRYKKWNLNGFAKVIADTTKVASLRSKLEKYRTTNNNVDNQGTQGKNTQSVKLSDIDTI
jgi:hypothetical protein